MEDIYANIELKKPVENNTLKKPSTNPPGPSSSKRSCHAVGICLGLLSVFLLAGLIGLGVIYAECFTVKANQTERLQISDNKFSSLTEEQDLLKVNLTEKTKELNRLNAELNTVKADLNESLQVSDNKLSSLTEERNLLKINLTETTKELNRLNAELYTVKAGLNESLQISDNKFSTLTEERDLLKVNLTETTKELDRLNAELNTVKADLTERLRISDNKLSSLTEERDLLKVNLTETTKELNRLKHPCLKGWTLFGLACYFISTESGSWEKGREDCRNKGADLVAIESTMEQNFLTKLITQDTWIGLNDSDIEGTWKWTDGSPLTQSYWWESQPDNGNGNPKWGEEDCAHLQAGAKPEANWNDRRCSASLKWICEKMA